MLYDKYRLLFLTLLFPVIFAVWQKSPSFSGLESFTFSTYLTIQEDLLFLDQHHGTFFYQGKPFTGVAESFYPNGVKAKETSFRAGKKQGISRKWFSDGQISFEAQYLRNRLHGMAKTWWKNGQLRSWAQFNKGILEGTVKEWYKSGAKFKEMHYVQGKEEGLQKAWRENSKIYNNYEAKNNRIFGLKRANLCYELKDENVQYKK